MLDSFFLVAAAKETLINTFHPFFKMYSKAQTRTFFKTAKRTLRFNQRFPNKIINDISAKKNLKDKVKERGWDHPEWNRELQEMIFDKYLWNVGTCSEQEFLTTWELYQLARNELNNQGYRWNPVWNRYTPKQGSYEYVRGTQIYNNLLNSEFHRYGEDLSLQDDIFESSLIGKGDIFSRCLGRKEDGPTQYEEYLCCKTLYNSPNAHIILFRDINFEGVTYNKYGEPFHWYDDLMPFTPSKVFIMYPSEKTYYEYEAKGIDLQKMQEKMRYTAYTTLDQRRQALNARNERIRNSRLRYIYGKVTYRMLLLLNTKM